MKLSKKYQQCFAPHVMMHGLFGLGLGIFLASVVPSLSISWLGLAFMGGAFVLDLMRRD